MKIRFQNIVFYFLIIIASCKETNEGKKEISEASETLPNIVFFSADNGPKRYAFDWAKKHDHYSMGDFRGLKRDVWEGGYKDFDTSGMLFDMEKDPEQRNNLFNSIRKKSKV